MLCLELGRLAAEPVKMQRNEQLQRLASKVAASWTARASALDARDVFAEFVELRPALAENVDEGLRREVRNGEAAPRGPRGGPRRFLRHGAVRGLRCQRGGYDMFPRVCGHRRRWSHSGASAAWWHPTT